jgi:hypothetical protein
VPFVLRDTGCLNSLPGSRCELVTELVALDLVTLEVSHGRFSWLPIRIVTS